MLLPSGGKAHPRVVQLHSVFVLGVGLDGSEYVVLGVRPDKAHLAWSGMPCTQLATGGRLFAVMPVRLFLCKILFLNLF